MNKLKLKEPGMFKSLFLWFLFYSILGWCYEVFLEVVVYQWGFSNRGVLFGPYTPVYGFGALTFLFTIYPLIIGKTFKHKLKYLPIVYLGCMCIATLLELVTSYLCEWTIGSWPWQTYAEYTYNFQARIALSPSLRFGLGGVIFLYFIQPALESLTRKMGTTFRNCIFYITSALFLLDVSCTVLSKIV